MSGVLPEVFMNTSGTAIASVPDGGMDGFITTLTLPSYSGIPAHGFMRIVIDSERILITDTSARPLTLKRGDDGSTPTSHVAATPIFQRLTVAALLSMAQLPGTTRLTAFGQFR